MRSRIGRVSLAAAFLVLGALAAAPASAANKEHQQLMADIRMLQEQAQLLQNLLGNLNESIKIVNTRLDQQDAAMRKAFADQKLPIDNLTGDLRVVREKVDDNNVRIGSLKEELEALRQTVQQLTSRPTVSDAGGAGGTTSPGGAPAGPPSGTAGGPSMAPGTSPANLWEMAYADYTLAQWDLAIQGFESFIRYFPKSDRAAEAQVKIGASYDMAGNKPKALEAFDKAIRDYPAAAAIPDAYYRKGVVLIELKQPDKAREAFEFVAKNFPESAAGGLARQKLDQMKK
jgi:TolA-binding protein